MNNNNLTQEQTNSLNIMINALRLATKKGSFTLEDTTLISDSIRVFYPEYNRNVESQIVGEQEEVSESSN